MNIEPPDEELMARIARGQDEAMLRLIERHQHAVYGTIVKMLSDPIEAEDIAQQVFVRVYRAAPSYRPTASFRTWLFTILRRLVFNEHRRRGRARLEPLHRPSEEGGDEIMLELLDQGAKNPSQQALDRELMQAIDRAILALPEQQRLAVVLRRYDEFSYEEIAGILQTSVSATKSLLFRARETLRAALASYLQRDIP
jgi:RNA polymerase sigma-70 factor (ECF subfamily)